MSNKKKDPGPQERPDPAPQLRGSGVTDDTIDFEEFDFDKGSDDDQPQELSFDREPDRESDRDIPQTPEEEEEQTVGFSSEDDEQGEEEGSSEKAEFDSTSDSKGTRSGLSSAGKKRLLIGLFVVLVIVAVVVFLFSDRFYNMVTGNASYTLSQTGTTVDGSDAVTTVALCGSNVIRCTQDGVQAVSENGTLEWDLPFTMSSPYILTAGDYVSVADRLGVKLNNIKDGKVVTDITTESNILLNCVNAVGETAAVLEADKGHTVILYDVDGNVLLTRRTYSSTDGVPVAIALDDTGTRLGTVYVTYAGSKLTSIVTIFDLTESGSVLADRIIGSLTFEDCVISDLKFTQDGCFYAGTDRFGEISCGKSCDKIWESTLNYQIAALAMTDDYYAVLYGDGQPGVAEPVDDNVVIYNYSGKILSSFSVEDADYLDAWGNTVICGASRSYTAVTGTGKALWSMDAADSYSRLIAFPNGKEVAALTNGSLIYYKVTLKGASENAGQ